MQLLLAKGRKRKARRVLRRSQRLKKMQRILRLAKVPRRERLLQLPSDFLPLRSPRRWLPLLLGGDLSKEVSHPSILKIKVKTKVEISKS